MARRGRGGYSLEELAQLRAGVVRNGDMSSISRDIQERVNAERDARIRKEQADSALNQARAAASQDGRMRAEKAFQDRLKNLVLPPKSGVSYPARDVERPPVVNWAPNRGNSPVRDVVNPNIPGMPSKEQVATNTAEQDLGEEDFIQSYQNMLDRLNLSRMRKQR